MRQFNYFYTSFIENKHGFFTFIPHANMFHPYFGLGDIGFNGEYNPYLPLIKLFHGKNISFKHTIKIFFPEIREGYIYVDKLKYSVNTNPIDGAEISYNIEKNSEYSDYVPIKNHIAEFKINIVVKTKYSGIWYPINVSCDYVDILLFQQRISITETQSSIKMIPYLGAYHTDKPLFYLTSSAKSVVNMRNTTLTYDVLLPKESAEELAKYNFQVSEFLSRMDLSEEGKKIYKATFDAFSLKYAIEPYIESKFGYTHNQVYNSQGTIYDLDFLPMINNMWFLDAFSHCKVNAQSYWYTTVYDKNWLIIDLPNSICLPPDRNYTADETRGYVWYKIIHNYEKDENQLHKEAAKALSIQNYTLGVLSETNATTVYDELAKFYKKD